MAGFEYAPVQFRERLGANARATPSTAARQMKMAEHELPYVGERPPTPTPNWIDVNADCQSIVVKAPVTEVYRRCLSFEEFPQFITSITNIDRVDDTRFSCTSIINGEESTIEVKIIIRVPNRRIAWQAVSDNFRVGVVFFDPLPGGATKVTVKVRSIIEPVMLTAALRNYLRNFKQFVEGQAAT
jgi:uncharacterized membrane protein